MVGLLLILPEDRKRCLMPEELLTGHETALTGCIRIDGLIETGQDNLEVHWPSTYCVG